MTRSGKIFLFLLAGAGILVALLAALVFLGPRLLNTKAVRDLAMAELERRTGVHLSYARAEVTFFPRPRVVIRGVAIDVPGLAAGTVATLQVDLELIPLLRGQRPQRQHPAGRPGLPGADPPEAEARKSVLPGGVRGEPLFPPRHAARKRARNGRHGAERAPRTLGWGRTDRVPSRTECPGRLSTGTDDASGPLRVPVLGKSFDRVEPAPGGASRGHPCGDGGVPGPRFRRPAGAESRPLARQNGRVPSRQDRNGRVPVASGPGDPGRQHDHDPGDRSHAGGRRRGGVPLRRDPHRPGAVGPARELPRSRGDAPDGDHGGRRAVPRGAPGGRRPRGVAAASPPAGPGTSGSARRSTGSTECGARRPGD